MQKNGIMLPCERCGRLVYIPKARQKKFRFCSYSCHAKTIFTPELLKKIKRGTGPNHWRWKKGGCKRKDGYILITIDGKRMFQHRYIMEKYLGRKLIKDENVHHINGNKSDNRIKNLRLYKTKSEHSIKEKHYRKK